VQAVSRKFDALQLSTEKEKNKNKSGHHE